VAQVIYTHKALARCRIVQDRLARACARKRYGERMRLSPDLPADLTVGRLPGTLYPQHMEAMEALLGELEPETETVEQA